MPGHVIFTGTLSLKVFSRKENIAGVTEVKLWIFFAAVAV
jgi:hypothetical protein